MFQVASSSRSALGASVRCFSTSAVAARSKGPPAMKAKVTNANEDPWREFRMDDISTAGWAVMDELKEMKDLVQKVYQHRPLLESQRQKFVPPRAPLRITSTIDMDALDTDPAAAHRTLVVPVARLGLRDAAAINRAKLIAGPRWSPGFPSTGMLYADDELSMKPHANWFGADFKNIGREGWIKFTSDRFPTARMNRKFLSDALEKLVAAANDFDSPIPSDVPVDVRHLVARLRRKKGTIFGNLEVYKASKARPQIVGGVQGFPVEWLRREDRWKFRPSAGEEAEGSPEAEELLASDGALQAEPSLQAERPLETA